MNAGSPAEGRYSCHPETHLCMDNQRGLLLQACTLEGSGRMLARAPKPCVSASCTLFTACAEQHKNTHLFGKSRTANAAWQSASTVHHSCPWRPALEALLWVQQTARTMQARREGKPGTASSDCTCCMQVASVLGGASVQRQACSPGCRSSSAGCAAPRCTHARRSTPKQQRAAQSLLLACIGI